MGVWNPMGILIWLLFVFLFFYGIYLAVRTAINHSHMNERIRRLDQQMSGLRQQVEELRVGPEPAELAGQERS